MIINDIANNRSNLVLDGMELTRDEDVFPFRAQWRVPEARVDTRGATVRQGSRNAPELPGARSIGP